MKQFYELLSKLKYNIIKRFSNNKADNNKEISDTNNSKKHIMSLVPVIIDKEEDGKPNKAYSAVEDIVNALKEKEIKNIALTGSYGSGKSSVLKTLEQDYKEEYTYLNISLATLKDNKDNNPKEKDSTTPNLAQEENKTQKKDKDKTSGDNEINRLIEYSILQQIIYKENIDSLPQSRFKRIKNIDSKRSKKYSLFVITFLLAVIILFEPRFLRITWIYRLLSCDWLNIPFDIISILYMLWILFQVGRKLIIRLCNNKLNKFNIKECAIEINEETSIFNKHLDEILYFFEVTKYNVVIIEDLDRFDTQDIFLKLRELNQIINESKSINRKIVFIYAVRDDIFKDRNRTKFFDYIVTVIPVINSHNSCDILLKEIPELKGKESFCNDIGLFIDDMRILINIKNEFEQFKRRLGDKLEYENLFAMIVYKNYFPDDFIKLQNRRGLVYSVIKNKIKYIKKIIDEKYEEIKYYEDKIEEASKYKTRNEIELRTLYVMRYIQRLSNFQKFTEENGTICQINKLVENKDFFEKLISNKLCYKSYSNPYQINMNINFKEIEDEVDKDNDYQKRLSFCIPEIEYEYKRNIEEAKKEIIKIKGLSLKEILSEFGDNIFKDLFKGDKDLILFMIKKGYINENYNDYISYFYPGTLTYNDKAFIKNLALSTFKADDQYVYNIDKPESTIDKINDFDFSNKNILNRNILDFLAEDNSEWEKTKEEKYGIYFSNIIDLIIKEHSFDFIISYYDPYENQQKVFNLLFNRWHNYPEDINIVNNTANIDLLLVIYIKYLPSYISINRFPPKLLIPRYYLLLKNIDLISIDNAKKITKDLSIKYKNILLEDYFKSKEDNNEAIFWKYVVDNKNYILNWNNLNAIFNYYNTNNLDFKKAIYSYVLTINNQNVIDYIDENIDICLNELFPESSIDENEDTLVKIINWDNDSLSEKRKEKYLSEQKKKIQNIDSIEKEYWDLAIEINIISSSWKNIYQYFSSKENQVNELLLKFILDNEDVLISNNSINEFEDAEDYSLFEALFNSNTLPTDSYRKLLSIFDYCFGEEDDLSSLEEERMKILVENDKLQFTKEIYTLLNDNFDRSLLRLYVINNQSDYINNITEYTIEISDAIYFLKSDKFSKEEKIEIIESFDVDFIENNVQLADIICEFMVNHQYIEIDIDLNLKIITLCSNNTLKLKIVLMFFDRNEYDKDIVTYFLDALGKPYNGITKLGLHPKIPNNELTKELIKYLKEEEYISTYKEDGNIIKVNNRKSL